MNGALQGHEKAGRRAASVSSAPGPSARLLASIGVGCYLGWQTVDISPTLFPDPLPGVQNVLNTWGYVGTAILMCLLAALALSARRTKGRLLAHRWLVIASCAGPAIGTALMYACGWAGDSPAIPGVVIGRLLFACSAGLVALWGDALAVCGAAHMLGCIATGYALSFGICLVEAHLAPQAALLLRPVLPLLSGAALITLREELGRSEATAASNAVAMTAYRPGLWKSVKPFIATGALGAVFIAANHLSETKTTVSTELYTLIAGIAVCLVIVALARLTQGRIGSFARLYRLITPLVIGCLLLTLVLEPGSQRYEALAIGGSWAFFRVFTWTLWARIGEHNPSGGAFVFAVGQIALTACSTTSEMVCGALDLEALPLVGTAAAIIGVTVLVSVFLLDDNEVMGALEDDAQAGGTDARAAEDAFDIRQATLDELADACSDLPLSEREREISLLVAKGEDNAAICAVACITESTLRTHLRNIYAKTGAHSREELIEIIEQRLLERQVAH